MKILEINKFNFPKGGADRHFLDLVELLRSQKNEVAVFAMDHPKNLFSPWKKYFVSYVAYNQKEATFWQIAKGIFRMFYSFESKRKIRKLLRDFQPDIVHIHNIYHQISPSILSEIKKRNIPIIMTVHDYELISPDYLMRCESLNWLTFIKNKCFKNSYLKSFLVVLKFNFHRFLKIYEKNIDLFISPSHFTKNVLAKNGIPKNKIVVIPHFYSEVKIENIPNSRKRYVLYAGRISRDKGVRELIRFFQNHPETDLYLAGAKDENFKLEESGNIKYLGFLPKEELYSYIKNSLFVVSFSRLPETFGLIALEAAANRKPFIGYDSGAYGEIVENGKTGYICRDFSEMKENIQKLLTDEGLRILLSRNASAHAKNFESKAYYKKIMGKFKEAIEDKKSLTFIPFNDTILS